MEEVQHWKQSTARRKGPILKIDIYDTEARGESQVSRGSGTNALDNASRRVITRRTGAWGVSRRVKLLAARV